MLLQICPIFIKTRDCFRILGHLRSIHFAGEENPRERFKGLNQGLVREKPLLESAVFKSKSTSKFTHFTSWGYWMKKLYLVLTGSHLLPKDLDTLSDPIAICKVAGVFIILTCCFMDQHDSGCEHILGDIMSCHC